MKQIKPFIIASLLIMSVWVNAWAFDIQYDEVLGEIHVYGLPEPQHLTQGTAIIVHPGWSKVPVVRINLLATNLGSGGKIPLSKDFPLYLDGIILPPGSDPTSKPLVKRIWYHGTDERDQFSNYTDIPLHASGKDGDDFFLGGGGDDDIHGGDGADEVRSEGGNDEINGGNGDDELSGGPGNDIIKGYTGDDILRGGDGNDELFPFWGSDQSFGGSGNDLISVTSAKDGDQNLLCGQDGQDVLEGARMGVGVNNTIDTEPAGAALDYDVDTIFMKDSNDDVEFDENYTLIYKWNGKEYVEVFPSDLEWPVSVMINCG